MSQEVTTFHQLGKFIYSFQMVELQIDDIIILLIRADDEMVSILMSELDLSKKLKAVDVLLSRFIDVRRGLPAIEKVDFHKLISRIIKLCERRNDIAHSKYHTWQNIEGRFGLLRQNSKLRASKGIREESEEELLPEAFDKDFKEISICIDSLENYRLKIIDWLYELDEG